MTNEKLIDASEGATLASRVVAAILTVMLFGSAYAVEQNGLIRLLIEETGFIATTLVSLGSVAVVFHLVRKAASTDNAWVTRGAYGGAVLGAVLSVADAANNLYVLSTTGLPDGMPPVTPLVVAVAVTGAVVAYRKPTPRPALRRLCEGVDRNRLQQAGSVAFSILVVSSMFVGIVQFGVGGVEAAAPEDGKEVWNHSLHGSNTVNSVTETSDGLVVSAGYGNYVRAYDPGTGEEAWNHSLHSSYVTSVIETDGGLIVSAGDDNMVRAYDPGTGEEVWNYSHGDRVWDITQTSDGLIVSAGGDGAVRAYDPDTDSEVWSHTLHGGSSYSVYTVMETSDGLIVSGGNDNTVQAYDPDTDSQAWSHSLHGSTVKSLAETDGGLIVSGDSGSYDLIAYDPGTGSEAWSKTLGGNVNSLIETSSDLIVAGVADNSVRAFDPSTGDAQWDYSIHSDGVKDVSEMSNGRIVSGGYDDTVRAYDYGYSTSDPVNGTVEDQSGAPVSNATVEVWGTYSSVGSISEQEATLDGLADPTPPGFDADFDARSNLVENSDVSGDVPLVYSTEEIGATAYSDGPSMETPRVQVPAGEPFAVVKWNPSADSGLLGTADAYERQMKGEPSSGKVKIERVGPGGDATDTLTVETDERISSDAWGVSTRLQYAEVSLSPGYYEVTSINEDGQNHSYLIQVGTGEEIINLVRDDLEDTQDQLSDRAQQVRDAISNDRVYRTTVTTDANGQFSAEVPSGVQVVQVQAYSAGGVLDGVDPSNRSLSEARSLAQSSDYTGKWYIGEPTRVEAPASGVTVGVVGFDTAPNTNMTEVMNQFDSWQEFLDSEYGDTKLADLYEERMDEVGRDRLESFYNDLKPVIESNPALQERAEEINGGELKPPEDASTEELRSQLDAMQQAVTEMESTVGGNSDVTWNDDGTVDYTFETDAGLLEGVDSYSVLAIAPDGSTEPVPDEKVSASGDTVSVEGYEVPSDQSGVKFRLVADAGEEIVQDATRSTNPAFSGNVPALESISVGTNIPQVGETVTMTLNAEDEIAYGSVQSATVYGPNGEVNATVVDGQTVRFTPGAAGEHDVRVVYTNSDGTTFAESVTLQAKENAQTTPPSVRIVDGTNSRYALASGVEAAEVETVSEGSSIDVTVQLARGEIPSEIDIYAGSVVSGPQQEIDVQVVEGAEQSAVSEQITVQVHTGEIGGTPAPWSDGAVVERVAGEDGEPIPRSGGAAGDVDEKQSGAGTTITTYTDETGGVTVSVDNDPGIVERATYWASQQLPDLPSLPFGAVSVNGDGLGGVAIGGIGLAGLFARRRAA
ncbi:WD40 repeat domain-containing protein [Halopenitus persicus]|uniref:WD40 repeat domain-containing protein n=1 Tax=Halopenitus persicus TaxID=1048396 RepID=UPI000BBA4FF3|nr:WD40 repeat domain-containing protein [Halopenitus persicus]